MNRLITLWAPQNNKNYSAPKARKDIQKIAENIGASTVPVCENPNLLASRLESMITSDYDKILIQYPLKPFMNIDSSDNSKAKDILKVIKNSGNYVVFTHDVKSIQAGIFGKTVSASVIDAIFEFEYEMFSSASNIIVHSKPMEDSIKKKFNIRNNYFTILEMFDYLSPNILVEQNSRGTIGFAGYLGPAKQAFIEKLISELPRRKRHKYAIFGEDFKTSFDRNDMVYVGSYSPESVVNYLQRKVEFGLIWDELNDLQREYYQIIIPHKSALYLRAGLPLITPLATHIADFTIQENIGVAVNELSDIPVPMNIREAVDYSKIFKFQQRVSSGYFTKKALDEVLI